MRYLTSVVIEHPYSALFRVNPAHTKSSPKIFEAAMFAYLPKVPTKTGEPNEKGFDHYALRRETPNHFGRRPR